MLFEVLVVIVSPTILELSVACQLNVVFVISTLLARSSFSVSPLSIVSVLLVATGSGFTVTVYVNEFPSQFPVPVAVGVIV